MEAVNRYKIILDNTNINKDKEITINLGHIPDMCGHDDLINQRVDLIVDDIFKNEYPTIDFEKYKFRPNQSLKKMNLYFYKQQKTTKQPISYNDTVDPEWLIVNPTFELNCEIPSTNLTGWKSSYFKYDFYLTYDGEQKILYSVALPVNGTMLISGQNPKPQIIFNKQPKTEINDIFWLRKPEQLPNTILSGNTLNLYCTVSFYNNYTGKVQRFKTIPSGANSGQYLPNSNLLRTTFTEKSYFLKYTLDYSTLTYTISRYDGTSFTNGIINLYSN